MPLFPPLSVLSLLLFLLSVKAWQVPTVPRRDGVSPCLLDRSGFWDSAAGWMATAAAAAAAAVTSNPAHALAEPGATSSDTTTFKNLVEMDLPVVPTGRFPMAVQGHVVSDPPHDATTPHARVSYQLPDDWHDNQNLIILAYQKTGTATYDGLEKAAQGSWKVARALDVGDRFPLAEGLKQRLNDATLVHVQDTPGLLRTIDFDLTSGLSSFYIRAVVLDTRLYVLLLECTTGDAKYKDEATLKRIRSSFWVERA